MNKIPFPSEEFSNAVLNDFIKYQDKRFLQREMLKKKAETVIPDLTGFLHYLFRALFFDFINDGTESLTEFEVDYLKKHQKDSTYEDIFNYSDWEVSFTEGTSNLHQIFLNVLFNGFQNGGTEAKETLLAILKRYEKQIYGQVKRYRSMSKDQLVTDFAPAILNPELFMEGFQTMAVAIAVCLCMDIRLESDAWACVDYMNSTMETEIMAVQKTIEQAKRKHEIADDPKKIKAEEKACKKAFNALDIYFRRTKKRWIDENTTKLMHFLSLRYDLQVPFDNIDPDDMEYAFEMLYEAGIDIASLSGQELVNLAVACISMDQMVWSITDRDELIMKFAYSGYHDPFSEECPVAIPIKTAKTAVTKKEVPIAEVALNDKKVDDSDYIAEINRLRVRLQQAEYKAERQRELYENEKLALLKLQEEAKEIPELKDELKLLRDFAYEMTQHDDEKVTGISQDEMLKYLNTKKCLIIGGDENWTAKLKSRLPEWKFASPEADGSKTTMVVNKSDYVFIFTEHIGHPQYYRYMEQIRKAKVSMQYVSSVNIDNNIQRFYECIKG